MLVRCEQRHRGIQAQGELWVALVRGRSVGGEEENVG